MPSGKILWKTNSNLVFTNNKNILSLRLGISHVGATGRLKIKNDQFRFEIMYVYNIFGKEVMTSQSENEIDFSPFPAGIYIVEVSGKDFLWREKVLKTGY